MNFVKGRVARVFAASLCIAISTSAAIAQEGAAAETTIMASASAQIGYDTVIANLRNDGFTVMRISKTFLGRIRITSRSSQYMREIVLSRTTGEIMRDVLMPMDAGSSAVSGGGSGGGGGEETASGTVGKVKETLSSTTSTVTSTTKKTTSTVKKEVEKVTGGLGLGG